MTTATEIKTSPHRSHARLLYRGSLSLPDSNLLLDGLTFTIDLPSSDAPAARTLLETPLPLALESLRGRSSIRFIDIVDLHSLIYDFSEKVHLYVGLFLSLQHAHTTFVDIYTRVAFSQDSFSRTPYVQCLFLMRQALRAMVFVSAFRTRTLQDPMILLSLVALTLRLR